MKPWIQMTKVLISIIFGAISLTECIHTKKSEIDDKILRHEWEHFPVEGNK